AVAFKPAGRIAVAGSAQTYPDSSHILTDTAVGRLNADGTPDMTFGTGGSWVKSFDSQQDSASDVLVDSGGRILVGGQTDHYLPAGPGRVFTLSRLTSTGAPDASFAGGGSQ